MLNNELLEKYGTLKKYNKHSLIFPQEGIPRYFYQIQSGSVEVYNLNSKVKKFIQAIFKDQESFGEPPLLGGFSYPAYAEAKEDSLIWRIEKDAFLRLLVENPNVGLLLMQRLSRRLLQKTKLLNILQEDGQVRLVSFLYEQKLKNSEQKIYILPFTREEIADQVSLTTETTIRLLKKLAKENIIRIVKGKILIH